MSEPTVRAAVRVTSAVGRALMVFSQPVWAVLVLVTGLTPVNVVPL